MTIIASVDEINRVLECINPAYPRQNLENIKSNHCVYVLNQTVVEIILHEERPAGECRHLGGC